MDRRSWPWKKKGSDKSILVIDSAADASHSQIDKVLLLSDILMQIVLLLDLLNGFGLFVLEAGNY